MLTTRSALRLAGAALFCTAAGCATLLDPAAADQSRSTEPPKGWEAAVAFVFADPRFISGVDYTTRIEFHDGLRTRTVTGNDLFQTRTQGIRTPWYRLRTRGVFSTILRVTINHPGGAVTVADHPLSVPRDDFYDVHIRVVGRNPELHGSSVTRATSYPLAAGANRPAGDSLWIAYFVRGRYCFDCPTQMGFARRR